VRDIRLEKKQIGSKMLRRCFFTLLVFASVLHGQTQDAASGATRVRKQAGRSKAAAEGAAADLGALAPQSLVGPAIRNSTASSRVTPVSQPEGAPEVCITL
jgi:hypothetical protein